MDSGLQCYCTICGKFARSPVTLPNCLDVFCLSCIEDFIKVTRSILTCRKKEQTLNDLHCPNCNLLFYENRCIKGCLTTKCASQDNESNGAITDLEEKTRETIKSLKTCQEKFRLMISKLSKLKKQKLAHLNDIELRVKCSAKKLVEQINSQTLSTLSDLSKLKGNFNSAIQAEHEYYTFLSDNANHLAMGLESLLEEKSIKLERCYDKSFQRFLKINASSEDLSIPDSLLSKHKLSQESPGTIFSLQTSSEEFQMENEVAGSDSYEYPLCGKKKWSFRLQDAQDISLRQQGICFWPNDKCFVVADQQNGALLGAKVEFRPNKPFTEIGHNVTRDKFRPKCLVRMDRGAIWSSRESEPNLAVIDAFTRTVKIFDIVNQKFTDVGSRKFDLPNGLAFLSRNDGSFLVTDEFQKSLEMIDLGGRTLWTVGGKNSSAFSKPHQISVNYGENRIVVADESMLHFFDFDGKRVQQISLGRGSWKLNDVSVLMDGSLLVAEANEGRILKIDPRNSGTIEEILGGDDARAVRCMDVSSDLHLALAHGDGLVSVFRL